MKLRVSYCFDNIFIMSLHQFCLRNSNLLPSTLNSLTMYVYEPTYTYTHMAVAIC